MVRSLREPFILIKWRIDVREWRVVTLLSIDLSGLELASNA